MFGEGPRHAAFMLVGEQPGDVEDRQGRPFVGPAGRSLGLALGRAGIDRRDTYVTNAVKHFKWVERGRRRIHQKPNALEVAACRPWLLAEVAIVEPSVLVLMGATAAMAVLGSGVRIGRDRGRVIASSLGPMVVVTAHPSSILRIPDEARRHEEMEMLVRDLATCALLVSGAHPQPSDPAG